MDAYTAQPYRPSQPIRCAAHGARCWRAPCPTPRAGARHRAADAVRGLPRTGRMATASARIAGRNCRSSNGPYCPRLGIPFVYDPGPDMLSMEAIANPPAYQRARAAVRYDDVAELAGPCAEISGPHRPRTAMGRWMARAGTELLDGADILIPVPLHWRRGWSRRYNQSGALARIIARESGVPVAAGHAAAHPSDPAAGRIVADRTRPQRSRRVQGCGRPHQPDPGPPGRS